MQVNGLLAAESPRYAWALAAKIENEMLLQK